MKFEGQPFTTTDDVEPWFSKFMTHYNFVIKYLVASTSRKFTMGKDIEAYTEQVSMTDGADFTIRHRMSYNSRNLSYTGRVECLVIIKSETGAITVTPRLLAFRLRNTAGYVDTIELEDTRLLKPSDVLKFGDQTRTVKRINGNLVYLDSEVNCANLTAIPLATDVVTVTVF